MLSREQTFFRSGCLDLAIDLGTEKQRKPGEIKPRQQNDDRSERALGNGEVIEEVQVDAEAD